MARKPNDCIVCGKPVGNRLYTANYCNTCRAAVSKIRLGVQRAMNAARLEDVTSFECVDCGKPAKEYDHRYYALPLEVDPVCIKCNQRRGPAFDLVHMARSLLNLPPESARQTLDQTMQDAERSILLNALTATRWNMTAAAKLLKISYRSMRYRIDKLGLDRTS